MIVLHTTAVPEHIRGALTRWLIEPTPGMYIGTLSARVRDSLWALVGESLPTEGAAVLIYPDANEQGFTLRTAGERRRTPIDFDGITLIAFRPEEYQQTANPS
ncbi:type I-E CRISPR-associated endoribonuclease Cas2e [Streptomyces fildesensis]|uniref:type I-E CRISPR-associated endoribonuclease Cas2e n=1 Tax=Streptomyces fildesensis TaxID=375757 RepID=UPI003F68432D